MCGNCRALERGIVLCQHTRWRVLSSSAELFFAMCSECLKADCGCLCSRVEKVVSSFGLRVWKD